MRIQVITLFPEAFRPLVSLGVTGRALDDGRVRLETINPRDFARDRDFDRDHQRLTSRRDDWSGMANRVRDDRRHHASHGTAWNTERPEGGRK